ncbi:MAG: peptidoglycan/LPS O-acetylase OafA/YrhL [Psychroserpens sp.]|jgi:peptidoglycan/LPS O-acetylase OafA/YrhL
MYYRADIQILRGVAVLLVVIYHLFPSALPNGYLGVDVFFVISGFLMASLYGGEHTIENAKHFLKRRFNRIFPAYLALIFFTALLASVIFSPQEYDELINQGISALLIIPNLWFWAGEDYFNNVAFTPLIHLWSLGVELQFYLIVPIFAWLANKNKYILLFFLIVSLVSCFVIVDISAKTAFFWLPFRIWEFLIGYIAALAFANSGNVKNNKPIFGLIVFLMLLIVACYPVKFNHHPGFAALITCLLTAMILTWGLANIKLIRIPFKIVEKVGTYSYSLYLVHFPIIAIIWYKPFNGGKYNITIDYWLLLAIAIMVLATFLIYQSFELGKIFKKWDDKKAQILTLILACIFVFILGPKLNKAYWGDTAVTISNAVTDRPIWRCGKLLKLKSIFDSLIMTCKLNEVETPKLSVLLLGDSHANALKYAFEKAATNRKAEALFMLESCSLGEKSCEVNKVLRLVKEKKISKLVLHDLHYSTNYDAIFKLLELKSKNLNVYFVKPIPTYDVSILSYLFDQIIEQKQTGAPLKNVDYFVKKYQIYDDKIKVLFEKGLISVDTLDVFCKPDCLLINKTKPLYFDNHHLTITGSEMLIKRLETSIFE